MSATALTAVSALHRKQVGPQERFPHRRPVGLDHHRIVNVVHRQIHSTPWSVASWLIDGQGVLERVGRSGGVFEINALGRRQHPGKSTNTAPGPHPRFTHLTAGEVLDRQTGCYRPLEGLCSKVAPGGASNQQPAAAKVLASLLDKLRWASAHSRCDNPRVVPAMAIPKPHHDSLHRYFAAPPRHTNSHGNQFGSVNRSVSLPATGSRKLERILENSQMRRSLDPDVGMTA